MKQWIKFQAEGSSYIEALDQIVQVRYSKENTEGGMKAYLQVYYVNTPSLILDGQSATDVWDYLKTRDGITVIESLPINQDKKKQH